MNARDTPLIAVPDKWWTRHSPEVFLENVHRILPNSGNILDYGAGRGKYLGKPDLERLADFRGPDRAVTGFDIDPAVRGNPFLDHALTGDPEAALSFPDQSFDVIVSLAVFEHITNPVHTAAELVRVLKPGGWVCALTPHYRSYPAVSARLIPRQAHKAVLSRLKLRRAGDDIFPTFYRMNTVEKLDALFPGFEDHSYLFSGTPSYTRGVRALNGLAQFWDANVCARSIHVFKKKQ